MHILAPYLLPSEDFRQLALQDLRLPALETLVARGRHKRSSAVGLEGALCRAWDVKQQKDWPWAPLSLGVDGGVTDQAYWLRSDPVHIRIQRDRLILLGSDVLDIRPDEAMALCTDLQAHFGDVFHPLPLQPDRWYWRLNQDPQIQTTPISLAVGRAIEPLLPRGSDAPKYRALLNEIQMLMFNHRINQQREARNLPLINSVWLWGGGRAGQAMSKSSPFYSTENHLRAIAQQLSVSIPTWESNPEELDSDGLVLLNQLQRFGQYGDVLGWRAAVQELDQKWLAPLIKRGVELRIEDPATGNALAFRPQDRWKLWRQRKPLAARQESPALPLPPASSDVDEFGNTRAC